MNLWAGKSSGKVASGSAGVGEVQRRGASREQARPGIHDGLRDLLAAYRSSASIDGRKMLISQICLELRARHQQKEQVFYVSVREILSAAERR